MRHRAPTLTPSAIALRHR